VALEISRLERRLSRDEEVGGAMIALNDREFQAETRSEAGDGVGE
jgi:hypothetical protein